MGFTTYTLKDVERLRAAIGKGVQEVQYQDKKVKYNSIDDMLKALRMMEQELGLKKRSSRVLAEHDKGLC